uniref:Uncharacterized protein n=1 Tax=Anopheles merus TaxID=30066 RepID=A0A182VFH0_ANOME
MALHPAALSVTPIERIVTSGSGSGNGSQHTRQLSRQSITLIAVATSDRTRFIRRTSPGRQAQVGSSTSSSGLHCTPEQSLSHVGSQHGCTNTSSSQAAQTNGYVPQHSRQVDKRH